jgi:hypothetical protein
VSTIDGESDQRDHNGAAAPGRNPTCGCGPQAHPARPKHVPSRP